MNKTRHPADKASSEKPRISRTILGIILVWGVISALPWLGACRLPAASSLFATNTPTATTTSTSTPTATSTHTPTATPDRRVQNPENQNLYLYVNIEKNWHQARDYCASLSSHLVTLQDTSENIFIYELTSGNTWLGATDEVNEGTWRWVSGEPWEYTPWREGEPNDDQIEHYLTYHPEKPSFWNDTGNGNMFFVCEWESISP
jgi:hypothetical protein